MCFLESGFTVLAPVLREEESLSAASERARTPPLIPQGIHNFFVKECDKRFLHGPFRMFFKN